MGKEFYGELLGTLRFDVPEDGGALWKKILSAIGDLSKLNTQAKDNLVAAINEALTKGGSIDQQELERLIAEYLAANPPAPGDSGVYILSDGETIEDVPDDCNIVIDPSGEADGLDPVSKQYIDDAVTTILGTAINDIDALLGGDE